MTPKKEIIARLPRTGFVPLIFIGVLILGPGLLQPQLTTAWMFSVASATIVLVRAMQVKLMLTDSEVVVVNFLRTFHIPIAGVEVPPMPSGPGYLQLLDARGNTVLVGALPTWHSRMGEARARLVDGLVSRTRF